MAAYAALVSLMQTIDGLRNSSHISILPFDREILESTYEEVECLKQVLQVLDRINKYIDGYRGYQTGASTSCNFETKRVVALDIFESCLSNQFPSEYKIARYARDFYDESFHELELYFWKIVNVLDGRIRVAVHKLHRVLESIVSEFKEPIQRLSVDVWDKAKQEINSFIQMVEHISEEEISEDDDDYVDHGDDDDDDEDYDDEEDEDEDEEGIENSKMAQLWDEFPKTYNMIREIMTLTDDVVFNLESFIQRLDKNRSSSSRERLNVLDGQIREMACKLEDALEDHLSNQFLLQSESHRLPFSLDLQKVKQDINSFIQSVNTLKKEYINELSNPLPEQINDVGPSKIDVARNRSKVIGFSDEVHKFKGLLTSKKEDNLEVYSLVGMAGIGKTTLAKELFEDPSIVSHFSSRAWVDVGPKYQLKEILQTILVQVNPDIDKTLTEGNKSLTDFKKMLIESLKNEKYLIILDDLWDVQLFKQLRLLFSHNVAGSRVLLTTRIQRLAIRAYNIEAHKMRFLNKEESWGLLREKIFGEECCPPHLEKAGKKIAKNCEGLPLAIITVADLLSKIDKNPEYWNKVAEKKTSVFVDAYNLMENILYPSYDYLPQHLKVCFLYMGVFPQNDEISCSKLIKLLSAEKLLEPISSLNSAIPRLAIFLTLEKFAKHCLNGLVSTNVVMVREHKSNREMKTCSLHSAFWHLCIKEARKNKFSHVINCYADGFAQGIKSLRRLCIHNNILFGIKDVYNSMASVSNAHSLLCTGPYHQYPVPICFGLRLLRVLDALTIHFYEFPLEVLKLIGLRYLALTFNKNLPPGISKLWNLEFLIVCRHLSINFSESPVYLPMEIWDMKELKHLQIMGSDLLDPRDGALLENLLTLLDVNAHNFTKGIVKRIPNIMKLGIRIELAPNSIEPLSFFDSISHLHKLESLKCVVVNPKFRSEVVVPTHPRWIFPPGLKKLTLSGLGFPWKDMDVIASLPNLEVLKLRCYAFRGPKWEIKGTKFTTLRFLLIEDADLVHWTAENDSFRLLHSLSLKHCYKLQEIPMKLHYYLRQIDIVDCNPLVMTGAKKKVLNVHSSWDDTKLES